VAAIPEGPEPPAPDEPAPDEKDQERHHTWRLGKLALIGGLSAAGIGAVAGVVSSLITTHISVSEQRDQAREDFLRQQRQVVYSKFLTDHEVLKELEFSGIVGTPPKYREPATEESMKDAFNALQTDLQTTRLVGSLAAGELASEIVSNHFYYLDFLENAAYCLDDGGTGQRPAMSIACQAVISNGDRRQANFAMVREFISQAHEDLGVAEG
jgi:hypothetical protein